MACPPEIIVARAVGHGLMGQAQRGWGEQQGRWRGVALTGEDIDDDRRGMDAVIERFATSGLDGLKAILRHAGQDLDHLPIAVIAALQLAPDRGHGGGQGPVPEGRTVAQRPRFARQNRHIMPRVINGLASSEGAGIFLRGQGRRRFRRTVQFGLPRTPGIRVVQSMGPRNRDGHRSIHLLLIDRGGAGFDGAF